MQINKGDHILVDDDYNITGILDWEWAHTNTKSATFNSPIMLLPVAEFYDGNNQLGPDELVFAQLLQDKGHADLAEIVRQGRTPHQFDFCCGYDLADWEGFLGIFRGLRKALDVDEDLEWETWREKARFNWLAYNLRIDLYRSPYANSSSGSYMRWEWMDSPHPHWKYSESL